MKNYCPKCRYFFGSLKAGKCPDCDVPLEHAPQDPSMNQNEAIKTGREWLEHSPPFDRDAIYYGCYGMRGVAGFVCRECCFRISGRGCDLKRIASVPVWEKTNETCSLCIR